MGKCVSKFIYWRIIQYHKEKMKCKSIEITFLKAQWSENVLVNLLFTGEKIFYSTKSKQNVNAFLKAQWLERRSDIKYRLKNQKQFSGGVL